MAPKGGASDADADIRGQLAKLLGKDVALIGTIRRTQGDVPMISVFDVMGAITGCGEHAARDWQRLNEAYPEVRSKWANFKFPGRGQRNTPVADLPTVIEIIFLLPGRAAARVRSEAAKLFVRYLGGDLRLVDEVQQMAWVQDHLRENTPNQPLAMFGAAVAGVTDPGELVAELTDSWTAWLDDPASSAIDRKDTGHISTASSWKDKTCHASTAKQPIESLEDARRPWRDNGKDEDLWEGQRTQVRKRDLVASKNSKTPWAKRAQEVPATEEDDVHEPDLPAKKTRKDLTCRNIPTVDEVETASEMTASSSKANAPSPNNVTKFLLMKLRPSKTSSITYSAVKNMVADEFEVKHALAHDLMQKCGYKSVPAILDGQNFKAIANSLDQRVDLMELGKQAWNYLMRVFGNVVDALFLEISFIKFKSGADDLVPTSMS